MATFSHDEFDFISEVYFVESYPSLAQKLGWDNSRLKQVIVSLWSKGYLLTFVDMDVEVEISREELENHVDKYSYLASKKGLLAHNSKNAFG